MIHYSIDTITKESEKSWNEFNKGRQPDLLGKMSFMLGWLQSAYKKAYNDLPEEKKQLPHLEDKYGKVLDNN